MQSALGMYHVVYTQQMEATIITEFIIWLNILGFPQIFSTAVGLHESCSLSSSPLKWGSWSQKSSIPNIPNFEDKNASKCMVKSQCDVSNMALKRINGME